MADQYINIQGPHKRRQGLLGWIVACFLATALALLIVGLVVFRKGAADERGSYAIPNYEERVHRNLDGMEYYYWKALRQLEHRSHAELARYNALLAVTSPEAQAERAFIEENCRQLQAIEAEVIRQQESIATQIRVGYINKPLLEARLSRQHAELMRFHQNLSIEFSQQLTPPRFEPLRVEAPAGDWFGQLLLVLTGQ